MCKARVLDFVTWRSLVALVRGVTVAARAEAHAVNPRVNRR